MIYRIYFKPTIDFVFSLIALIGASPILIAVMVVLFFVNKGRVFFIQIRPGRDEKLFKLIKFQTMTDDRDESGNFLPDEKRLTKAGAIIRKLSLDELPQLLNILNGDMALIGPRPLLVEYLPLYNEEQKRRHKVKPGITGWAQVNGRNGISWEGKFKLDVWYVDNITLWLDVKIFFLTIMKIIKSEGINSSNSATMEKFEGTHSL